MLDRELEGLYHVPGDECLSKYEFGRRLAITFGFDPELINSAPSDQISWTAERPKRTCLDGSKIIQTLGITLPSLEKGLVRFRADHESGLPKRLQIASKSEELDA
jgi:dTDP-4-dehydrorhamnose reductase